MTNKRKQLSEFYDHEAEFDERIKPHVEAIFKACSELNIPCLVDVCYANQPNEAGDESIVGQAVAAHFVGHERTPPGMMMAESAITKGAIAALAFAAASGLLGSSQHEMRREDLTPAKSAAH